MKKLLLLVCTLMICIGIQGCAGKRLNHMDEANKAENSGRYADMLKHCQKVIEEAYPPPQAFKCIGDAQLKLGRRQEAESAYLTYLDKMPGDKEVRFELIELYMVDGRHPNALPHVEKILSTAPGNVDALVLLGQIHRLQGHCQDAKDAYKQALEISPHNSDAKAGMNQLQPKCKDAKHTATIKKSKPKPVVKQQTFQGGGKALDESEW